VAKLSPVRFYPEGLEGRSFAARAVVVHPDYAGGNKSDLAVVQLAEAVTGVDPLPLATDGPQLGEQVTLLGFGRTSEHGGSFGEKRATTSRVASILDTYYTVAGGQGNVCDGDSGGPTLAARGGNEVLLGVHSTKGAACGVEGYDMRVDTFRGWILAEAEPEATAAADHEPPSVRILSPGQHARVGQTLTVDVSATDDARVVQLVLRVDGQVAAALDRPPFSFSLDGLAEGTRAITVSARDAAGHTTEAAVQVAVSASAFDSPFGHSCDAADECQSRVCLGENAADSAGGLCSRACSVDAPCADGFACASGVCQPLPASAPALPAATDGATPPAAGCRLGTGPASADLGLLLGLLALAAIRRR
jgi:hypothetical protein